MTARSSLRSLLMLALLCGALSGARAHAQGKHHRDADPLADSDTPGDTDLGAAGSEDSTQTAPEPAPADEPAQPEPQGDAAAGAAPAEAEPVATQASLEVEPFVGGGFGTRAFERPAQNGVQRMKTSVFPAIDAGLRVTGWPHASFSLGVLLRYQSSLGMSVREDPPFALHNEVGVRAEHVELSAAPTFRLGDAPDGLAFAFPIGFGLRTFWPDVHHLMTPGYSLGGPLLRAELIAPVSDLLVLRVGPELQWIVMIDRALTDDGVASQAVGIGGEASLALRLSASFALQLDYREAHVLAPNATVGGASFTDVERFFTLGLSGRL